MSRGPLRAGAERGRERALARPKAVLFDWDNTLVDSWGTIQIALRTLTSRIEQSNVPVAGAVIAAVPIVVVLVLFQRHIVRGLTAGAVKG